MADDIEEVRTAETRRSKRPIDSAEKRRKLILKRKFLEALESNDWQQFREMLIHDLGQTPGTQAYTRSVWAWKDYHGEK